METETAQEFRIRLPTPFVELIKVHLAFSNQSDSTVEAFLTRLAYEGTWALYAELSQLAEVSRTRPRE